MLMADRKHVVPWIDKYGINFLLLLAVVAVISSMLLITV